MRRGQWAARRCKHLARISTFFEELWNRRIQPRGPLRPQLVNAQAWLARFGAEVEEEEPEGGGGQSAGTGTEEGAHQVPAPAPVTLADWRGKHMEIRMTILILMQTGFQCSPLSPTHGKDSDHQRSCQRWCRGWSVSEQE